MSNPRSTRQRKRRAAGLTPAELEWLTGQERENANKFERIMLQIPAEPEDFDRLEGVLHRAEGVVDYGLICAKRLEVAERRAEHRRTFPKHPAYLQSRTDANG